MLRQDLLALLMEMNATYLKQLPILAGRFPSWLPALLLNLSLKSRNNIFSFVFLFIFSSYIGHPVFSPGPVGFLFLPLPLTRHACRFPIMALSILFFLFHPTIICVTRDDCRIPICYCFCPVSSYPYNLIELHAIDANKYLQYLKHARDIILFSSVLNVVRRGYCKSIRCKLGDMVLSPSRY